MKRILNGRWISTINPSVRLVLMIILLWACAGLIMPAIATAQAGNPLTETMDAGNRLYEGGRFAEAALTYQGLVDQGVRDGGLFFNLGNAYFKQGDLGRAILNYERAMQRTPRDPDLRVNLRLANAQTADKVEAQRESLFGQAALMASGWLTLNEMALLGLFCWSGVALLWVLFKRYRSAPARLREVMRVGLAFLAILLVVTMILVGVRIYTEQVRPQAILLAGSVDALSGPNPNNITEFTLHAGAKVTILETRGQWQRLALSGDGLQGWIPSEAVALIQTE